MKNRNLWKSSKFIGTKKGLRASRNSKEVWVYSRLMVDIIAKLYERLIPKHVTGKLLDLGCGKVPLYDVYQSYIDENICVDIETPTDEVSHLDIVTDLNEPLPLKDNDFDTIILSDVLEHIRNPDALWLEMNRVLKTKGIIIMNVPFFYWIHAHPHDYFRYTKSALESMAEISHFKIIDIQPVGGAPEVVTDIFAKNVMHIRYVGVLLSILSQRITWWFIRTRLGKKISNVTSENFPFGYYLVAEKKANP